MNIMKTIVYQLGTENKYIYTVPPEQAVVCAYYQYGLTNTARTVYCGDFAAKAE